MIPERTPKPQYKPGFATCAERYRPRRRHKLCRGCHHASYASIVRRFLKGLISLYDICCIYGHPSFGKSAISPLTAYQIVLGDYIFGMRAKPGPALYIAAEDEHGMINRVAALRRNFPNAPEFRLVIGITDLLADGPDQKVILTKIDEMRPSTIWIDTMSAGFAGLEENDNKEMNRLVAVCRKFTVHGAAVILIHHPAKAEGSSTPRGGGALYGALDMAMQLMEKTPDGIVRCELRKNKNGPTDLSIAFRLIVVELGIDEDGDPITAIMAEPAEAGPKREKLSNNEFAGLTVFRELRSQYLEIDEEVWLDACEESGKVSSGKTPENRRRSARRILTKLVRKNYIKKLKSGQYQLVEDIPIDQCFSDNPDQPDQPGPNPDGPLDIGRTDRTTTL